MAVSNAFPCFLQSEEEIIDPVPEIKQQCFVECPKPQARYDSCMKGIKTSGEGDCESWYFYLLNCVNKCVAPRIFAATKGG